MKQKDISSMDFTKKMPYSSQELVCLYDETSSGHYFDKDTMRFFKSKVTGNFKRMDDKTAYFITTEKGPMGESKRLATLRKAIIVDHVRENGELVSKINIETVGDFNQMSLLKAKKALEAI